MAHVNESLPQLPAAQASMAGVPAFVTPDIPTMKEAGVAGYEAYVWMGLLAPKDTPAPIITEFTSSSPRRVPDRRWTARER